MTSSRCAFTAKRTFRARSGLRPTGPIDFPLAGRIQVAGLRTGEIQKLLTERLRAGYLKDPQVTVSMKEWNSRKSPCSDRCKSRGRWPTTRT